MVKENDFVRVELRDDGIAICSYQPDTVVDLDVAKISVSTRLECFNGKDYPIVVDLENLKYTNKEASKYLGTIEAYAGIKVMALIVHGVIKRNLARAYLAIKKSPVEYELFGNRDQAIKWIKSLDTWE
ncbi:MAG: DUF7793 family protein [Candidatus Kariarchaeaceae archaeon]|nr:MAG: hypothetical protein DRO61_08210 [Candidatus Bathyarchaeota archaeon]